MAPALRWPRVAAWLVTLALVAAGTWGGVQGVRLLQPSLTGDQSEMRHAQGLIVAIQRDDSFAIRVPGQRALLWVRPAPGAPISMDHLWRHLREHASTDIVYQVLRQGLPIAWIAD